MRFDNKSRRNQLIIYYICYLLIFTVVALIGFSGLLKIGKSFVYGFDGYEQQYTSMVWWGEYLRQFIKNILNGQFTVPMWSYELGFGGDILTTLNYYAIGDPLFLLSVFFKPESTEKLYNLLVILRLALAGGAFSAYCLSHRMRRLPVLMGALCYTFGGYMTEGTIEVFFLTPMIYLPIVLCGVDKVLKKKSPVLLVAFVFLSAISNFYFFYMITLFAISYVVIMLLTIQSDYKVKNFFCNIVRVAGWYAIGIGIAAAMLLPAAISVMNCGRLTEQSESLLVYPLSYYVTLLPNLLATAGGTGIIPVILVGVTLVFSRQYKNNRFRLAIIGLILMMLIPFFSFGMNAFSKINTRWWFGGEFLLCVVFVYSIHHVMEERKPNYVPLIVGCGIGLLWYLFIPEMISERSAVGLAIYLLSATVFAIVLPIVNFQKQRRWCALAALLLVCFSVIISVGYRYSPVKAELSGYMDTGTPWKELSSVKSIKKIKSKQEDENLRILNHLNTKNAAVVQKYKSVKSYWSVQSRAVGDYLLSSGIGEAVLFNVVSTQNLAYVNSFFNVGYIATTRGANLPYGIHRIYRNSKEAAYQNDNVLTMAYVYDSVMSKQEYDLLSFEERHEAVLQCAVLEEEELNGENAAKAAKNEYDAKKQTYTVQTTDGIVYDETTNTIEVTDTNAQLTLNFEGMSDAETHLDFINLRFTQDDPRLQETEEELTKYQQYQKKKSLQYWQSSKSTYVSVFGPRGKSTLRLFMPGTPYYNGVHDFCYNLGHEDTPTTSCTLQFSETGKYTFDRLEVVCQPMDKLSQYVNDLKSRKMENAEIHDNVIRGSINLEQPGILYLSVPYSEGWKAWVDGKEVKVLKTNVMGMGLAVDAGKHKVEMKYKTPGLEIGIYISFASVIVFLVISILLRRKQQKSKLE